MGKSCGKSFGKILQKNLAGESCGKSCGKILQENLAGNLAGKSYGKSCWKFLWETISEGNFQNMHKMQMSAIFGMIFAIFRPLTSNKTLPNYFFLVEEVLSFDLVGHM